MDIPQVVLLIGGAAVAFAFLAILVLFLSRRRVDLIEDSPTAQPEWMRSTPPPETMAARQRAGSEVGMYGEEKGERLASAFVEQIEDIFRAELERDPSLASYKIDLGTSADGGLEIWVDGECYTEVDHLPDARLRTAFQRAVQAWERR
ncbi:MAG: hypothetical protein GVY30_06415 [Chloroflexi bacterium]|nr:hypothetical protein [Chloroflexota bacterium]